MNPDNIGDILKRSLHVTLGATATLVEAIQDPVKQSEKFSEINGDWDRLAEDLAAKGATTEQEARTFVDGVVANISNPFDPAANSPEAPVEAAMPTVPGGIQIELDALTQELAALRQEIDNLQNSPEV
ncbi:MAG: hypothetical protein AAF651_01920 [Cyanobacteria bacterium P01_C01_bin.73]